jgi:hypothetical protein
LFIYQTDTPEAYYRISVFLPLLDNVLMDLKARFGEKCVSVFGLEMILPSKVSEATLAGLKNCAKK